MKNLLIITDKYFKEMGGSYVATSTTAYQLNNIYKVKLIFFDNGITKKNIDLYKIIKKSDFVHFFGCWSYSLIKSFLITKYLKKKFIITPMGALEPWSLTQKKLKKKIALKLYQKKILGYADLVHCTSKEEENNIKRINLNAKTKVLPHGISGTFFEKKHLENNRKKRALFFSRIHKKKGILKVLKVWNYLKPSDWEFHIIGPEGDNTYELANEYVKKNNLSDTIFFHEAVFNNTEKFKILSSHDLLILFSQNENFGFSIIEALRHSMPVLTTHDVPWENINLYDAGWYIKNDDKVLKDTLQNIFKITDGELLMKSKNAFKLSSKFEWKIVLPQMLKMYESLV